MKLKAKLKLLLRVVLGILALLLIAYTFDTAKEVLNDKEKNNDLSDNNLSYVCVIDSM